MSDPADDYAMAVEDFNMAVTRLFDEGLSIDQLRVMSSLMASVKVSGRTMAAHLEGQIDATLRYRLLADPDRHGFIPDADDLDNPFCAAVDKGGAVCGLPPSNGRHQ
jgi:hypothetical protein